MIALLLLVCATASQQPQADTGKHRCAPADDERPPAESVPIDHPPPAVAANADPREGAEPQEEKADAEVALVYLTAALAFFTFLLWISTQSLAAEAVVTGRRQATEVRESLDIGRRTVETMQANANMQLRAYVAVEDAVISDPLSDDEVRIAVHIKNFGQTPAADFRCRFAVIVVDDPDSARPDFESLAKQWSPQPQSSLAPGGVVTLLTGMSPFNTAERDALKKGTKGLYVFGEVHYEDAFGTGRSTRFSYRRGGKYGFGAGLLPTAEHDNKAD
jgi:hypothetical protein